MALLNSDFDILRGWPNGSAVAEDFKVGGTTNRPHKAGTWVQLDSAKVADATTEDILATDSGRGKHPVLIIEGYEDFSAQAAKKVTCLVGGGAVIRFHNGDYPMYRTKAGDDAAMTYAPGDQVCVVNGIIQPSYQASATAADIGEGAVGALHADTYSAATVLVLDAEAATVGHVVRYDSTNSILEIYLN
jgi:hypothetical protein